MYKSQVQIQRIWLSISIKMSQTSYHFEITTSERIIHVFGTIMSHSDEGVLIDLWCPEEPCLTQRINISKQDIGGAIEALLQDCLEKAFISERPFSICCSTL